MSAIRNAETRAERVPDLEQKLEQHQIQLQQQQEEEYMHPEKIEQLYIDVLYVITNTVGAPAPGGQV